MVLSIKTSGVVSFSCSKYRTQMHVAQKKPMNSKAAHAQNENMETTGFLLNSYSIHVRVTVFIR